MDYISFTPLQHDLRLPHLGGTRRRKGQCLRVPWEQEISVREAAPVPKSLPERIAGSGLHVTSLPRIMTSGRPKQSGRRERSSISTLTGFLKQVLNRRVTFNRSPGPG